MTLKKFFLLFAKIKFVGGKARRASLILLNFPFVSAIPVHFKYEKLFCEKKKKLLFAVRKHSLSSSVNKGSFISRRKSFKTPPTISSLKKKKKLFSTVVIP